MRHHCVDHRKKLLLLLDVLVVDLVRHVDQLDEHFGLPVVLEINVGTCVDELGFDLKVLLGLIVFAGACELEKHVVQVVRRLLHDLG